MALASAILHSLGADGILSDFVKRADAQKLRILEINQAGSIHPILSRLPGLDLKSYPELDMMKMNVEENTYDLVVHSDTLEHVSNPIMGLSECHRVLKPNGVCCFTVPILHARLTRNRVGLPASYHGDQENPKGDNRVITEYGADVWVQVLLAGFKEAGIFCHEFPSAFAIIAGKQTPVSGRIITPKVEYRSTMRRKLSNIVQRIIAWNKREQRSDDLTNNGERVDINISEQHPDYDILNMYEKSHWKRYLYALERTNSDSRVIDVACGSGYGSALLASKARSVLGVDISSEVIAKVTKRYQKHENLRFMTSDLLEIPESAHGVDLIVSYETIEHIEEEMLPVVFRKFSMMLNQGGRLIMSTPFMQPDTKAGRKHHKTFMISEAKVKFWAEESGLVIYDVEYQDYVTHDIRAALYKPDFLIISLRKL